MAETTPVQDFKKNWTKGKKVIQEKGSLTRRKGGKREKEEKRRQESSQSHHLKGQRQRSHGVWETEGGGLTKAKGKGIKSGKKTEPKTQRLGRPQARRGARQKGQNRFHYGNGE